MPTLSPADRVLLIALKSVESVQALIIAVDRPAITKRLRDILHWLESLPQLDNELSIVAERIRRELAKTATSDRPPL